VEVEIANRESRIAHCGGVGQFEIRDSQSEIALHFVVRDSGVGIATAQQQRIFNAFEQAAGSTDHAVRGSGLGLAIVSKLVAMMGGTVWVQSEVGRGSVFHFTVRLGRAEQAGAATRPAARPGNGAGAAHTTPVAHPAPRALRILVVDDNPDNRRLMVVMLSKRGHSAVEANSGREAVAVVQRERFDAVLMDVQMPDMDGIAATQAIRRWEAEHAGRARLPIIAVTANAMIGDRARCFAAGMDSYLAKPFRVEQLVLALEALTGPTRSPEDAAAPAASAL
jgi:CheY-like chemotaxis protein